MDKILRISSPQAIGVSDGLYSFVVRLNEAPAEHWIYSFKLATPVAREFDPERVVLLRELGPPDGWGLLPGLVDAFVAEAPALAAAIVEALAAGDAGMVRQRAHRLRGMATNLGVVALADACAEIEAMGRAGELAGADGARARLQVELERGTSALQAALAGP